MGLFSFLFGRTKPHPAPRSRKKPLVKWREGSFPMEVVGESQYQDALIAVCGPHTRHGHDEEYEALLELEPDNQYDANAVRVSISRRKVGYLSREQADRVGSQMRDGGLDAVFCNARVRGGWRTNQYDEGHYGVFLSIPNQGWIDLGIGAAQPLRQATPRQRSKRPHPAANGPLKGHWVVLQGAASDGDLARELAAAGANIMAGIGSSTTLLVVAAERPFSVGIQRSATYDRAQVMIAKGSNLKVVSLTEARRLIATEV
jgi:hypothetical protein